MKIKLAQLLAFGALAVGSVPAFALTAVPTNIDYTAPLVPTSDDGTVLFHLYSTDQSAAPTNYSYTASLGATLSQVLPGNMTTTLVWNLTGLDSLPASLVSSGNLAWGITALNYAGNLPTAGVGGLQLATTLTTASVPNLAATTNNNLNALKNALVNQLNQINTFCPATSPGLCSTSNPADLNYWPTSGGVNLGSGTLVTDASPTSSLAFYLLSNSSSATNGFVTAVAYAGTWTLDLVAKTLSYTVANTTVPLPAAAWLLLSGVAGLGAIGRRRKLQVA